MLLSALKIHDGAAWLPDGSIIDCRSDGYVRCILPPEAAVPDLVHEGVLCPGFVNAHCHTELSHLRGQIPMQGGLPDFLQSVMRLRNNFSDVQIREAQQEALDVMKASGIVALGDIANTPLSIDFREFPGLYWHTFVECMGFVPSTAQKRFEASHALWLQFQIQSSRVGDRLRQSLVPHAPYSVSEALFRILDTFDEQSIVSVHNQETEGEDQYYRYKHGQIQDFLHAIGIDDRDFQPSGQSSLSTYSAYIHPSHPLLLVHNTFSTAEDIDFAEQRFPHLYWCLCPNANLYIEGRLPDIPLLAQKARHICIGTDSLASNHTLSVLDELQTIHKAFPALDWEILLRWGTFHGAEALGLSDFIGRIAPGKKPGLLGLSADCSRLECIF